MDYESQKPKEIAVFMQTVHRPWIAFKVVGAGTVRPEARFRLAFSMGADFPNVGVFDFQVSENARLVRDLTAGQLSRRRPWTS